MLHYQFDPNAKVSRIISVFPVGFEVLGAFLEESGELLLEDMRRQRFFHPPNATASDIGAKRSKVEYKNRRKWMK